MAEKKELNISLIKRQEEGYVYDYIIKLKTEKSEITLNYDVDLDTALKTFKCLVKSTVL